MKHVLFITIAAISVVVLSSCATSETKRARGNFELSVAPLSEGETILYPRVYVDKKFIGHVTPSKPILYLKRGKHTLQIELDGYRTWEETIEVLGDPSQQVFHVQLEKLPVGKIPAE